MKSSHQLIACIATLSLCFHTGCRTRAVQKSESKAERPASVPHIDDSEESIIAFLKAETLTEDDVIFINEAFGLEGEDVEKSPQLTDLTWQGLDILFKVMSAANARQVTQAMGNSVGFIAKAAPTVANPAAAARAVSALANTMTTVSDVGGSYVIAGTGIVRHVAADALGVTLQGYGGVRQGVSHLPEISGTAYSGVVEGFKAVGAGVVTSASNVLPATPQIAALATYAAVAGVALAASHVSARTVGGLIGQNTPGAKAIVNAKQRERMINTLMMKRGQTLDLPMLAPGGNRAKQYAMTSYALDMQHVINTENYVVKKPKAAWTASKSSGNWEFGRGTFVNGKGELIGSMARKNWFSNSHIELFDADGKVVANAIVVGDEIQYFSKNNVHYATASVGSGPHKLTFVDDLPPDVDPRVQLLASTHLESWRWK